jgi:hypothetical protein
VAFETFDQSDEEVKPDQRPKKKTKDKDKDHVKYM